MTPALGPVASLSRRGLVVRVALLVAVAVVALVVRGSGLLSNSSGDPTLPPMPGAAKVIPGLLRAGVPSEEEMVLLRDTLNVRVLAVVGSSSAQERAAAQALGLQLVVYPMPGEAAPTAEQVNSLVELVAALRARGEQVFLHGTTDSGAAPTMGAMVQLAGGDLLSDVLARLTVTERVELSTTQNQALRDAAAGTGTYASLRKSAR